MSRSKPNDRCSCGSGKKFKRCCMVRKKYCYLDETGNTGLNHFDPCQPLFIQGCMISAQDIDLVCIDELIQITKKAEVSELHGNDLRVTGIKKIEKDLIEIIETHDLNFVFTIFEKTHHLAVMLFHLFFDSGLNPAIHSIHHNMKISRMILSLNFTTLVELEDLKQFWSSTQAREPDQFVAVMTKLLRKLEASNLDSRSKVLLGDAMKYTISNPKELFSSMSFSRSASPNLSAFTMMLNTINQSFSGKKVSIERFVHDEQDEFGRFLKEAFKNFSRVSMDTESKSLITDTVITDIIKPTALALIDSSKSPALQLVDIALWIFKSLLSERDLSLIEDLVNVIILRSSFDGVTLSGHQQFVIAETNRITTKPMTPEQIRAGKDLIDRIERIRRHQMEKAP